MTSPAGRRLGRLLSIVFGLVGVAFLVVTFVTTWNRSEHTLVPRPWPMVASVLPLTLALVASAQGWVTLLEGRARRLALLRAFYAAQLGKYIPGLVWQAVGQIGLSRRAGTGGSNAAAAFAVSAVCQAAAAGTVGATVVFLGTTLEAPLRVLPLLGLLLIPLLHRSWMRSAVARIGRILRRELRPEVIPPQRKVVGAYGWNVLSLVGQGAAFTLLLWAFDGASALAAPAYALAWLVGFLAVPFPAGIGVREAVLIGLLRGDAALPEILAASVAFRLLTMAVELLLVAVTTARGRRTDTVTGS